MPTRAYSATDSSEIFGGLMVRVLGLGFGSWWSMVAVYLQAGLCVAMCSLLVVHVHVRACWLFGCDDGRSFCCFCCRISVCLPHVKPLCPPVDIQHACCSLTQAKCCSKSSRLASATASALPSLKARMLKVEVVGTLLYGCVTWTLTAKYFARPRKAHRQVRPQVIGIRRRRRPTALPSLSEGPRQDTMREHENDHR